MAHFSIGRASSVTPQASDDEIHYLPTLLLPEWEARSKRGAPARVADPPRIIPALRNNQASAAFVRKLPRFMRQHFLVIVEPHFTSSVCP